MTLRSCGLGPLLLLISAGIVPARADVKLPAIISDHMVLQSSTAVPIWGWADPDEEVTVTLAGQSKTAKASAAGKWMVKLDSLQPNAAPQALSVRGKNTLTVNDVLVGEVWLGSGQSNMAKVMSGVKDAEAEIAAANYPAIRMFKVASTGNFTGPQEDCEGSWQVTSPATAKLYSATAYFFGRELYKTLNVPVGLINSSVGGTPIQSWISLDAQLKDPNLKVSADEQAKAVRDFDVAAAKVTYDKRLAEWQAEVDKAKAEGKKPPFPPHNPADDWQKRGEAGGLFNGKIAPLIPFAIRGMIWYQGEANSGVNAPLYRYQLPALIADWRARWGYDFPFIGVQLPNFAHGSNWPLLREDMLNIFQMPNTGMAITIDIGEPDNIHPKNKQEVGRRLALWALDKVYGQKVPSSSGPLPAGQEIRGHEIAVSFTHADGGLTAQGGELKEFQIAGADQKWAAANARIEGDKVIVSSPEVTAPVAVRYCWAMNPQATLYNGAGLPASPFRTDSWN